MERGLRTGSVSCVEYHSCLVARRPPFIEGGVPPPHFGRGARYDDGDEEEGGDSIIRRRSSLFQDDVGYIGYLTDEEDIVQQRRRELLNTDGAVSFSESFVVFVAVLAAVVGGVFLLWGFRLPAASSGL